MHVNKVMKEELAFTGMMVFGMVGVMMSYNAVLVNGFTPEAFRMIVVGFIPTYILALVIELFVVSHNVHKIHKILVSPKDPQFKHIIVLAFLFVTFMAVIMSLYGTLMGTGSEDQFWQHYFINLAHNWPVALFTQLAIMGPLVRILHMKLFKKTTLVD